MSNDNELWKDKEFDVYLNLVSRYESLVNAERAVRFCNAALEHKMYSDKMDPKFSEKYLRAQIAGSQRYLDSLDYTRDEIENLLEQYYEKFGWDNEAHTPFVQANLSLALLNLAVYGDTKKDGCQFCHPNLNKYKISDQFVTANRPIFETSLFTGLSDICPVNDGHILVAYKGHHLAASQTNWHGTDQLHRICDVVRSYNKDEHGKITEGFEHGTGVCGLGTCVDHTHVHLLTPRQSMADVIRSKVALKPTVWETLVNIQKSDYGYFLSIDQEDNLAYNNTDLMPSQFGRMVYGAAEGEKETNWRTNVNSHPAECIQKINAVKDHYAGMEGYIKKRNIKGFIFNDACKKRLSLPTEYLI